MDPQSVLTAVESWPVEDRLQRVREQCAAQHRERQEYRGAPAAAEQQESQRRDAEQHQHRGAAERGDVARDELDPGRTERIGGIAGFAQGEHHGTIEGMRLAVFHFIGELGEAQQRAAKEQHGAEHPPALVANLIYQRPDAFDHGYPLVPFTG